MYINGVNRIWRSWEKVLDWTTEGDISIFYGRLKDLNFIKYIYSATFHDDASPNYSNLNCPRAFTSNVRITSNEQQPLKYATS